MRAVLRLVVLVLMFVGAAAPVLAADTYLTSAAMRDKALAALWERIGSTPQVSRLTIGDGEMTVLVQSPQGANFADRWEIRRRNLPIIGGDIIGGPTPDRGDGVVAYASGSFFALDEVSLDRLRDVVASAVAFARLQSAPTSVSVEIVRRVSILPTPSYGEVRWNISLGTGRESARIEASADGAIIGGDLTNTIRGANMNLITDDEWPMDEAQRALSGVLGSAKAHRLIIYDHYLSLTADNLEQPKLEAGYSWDLGGVKRSLVDTPDLIKLGMGDMAPFDFGELDLTKLPAIKAAARKAVAWDGAVITGIEATRPTNRPGASQPVLWTVDLAQAGQQQALFGSYDDLAHVLVDTSGNVVDVQLPDSMLQADVASWLSPETLVQTLERLKQAFGTEARFYEISIDDERGSVTVEDPQAPGQLAKFIIDPKSIDRFGTPSFMADMEPEHLFTLDDIKGLDAPTLDKWQKATVARMKLDGSAVYRVTISRHALIMDPSDTRLLVEVRAGKDQGNVGGWVTYTLTGEEADVLTP